MLLFLTYNVHVKCTPYMSAFTNANIMQVPTFASIADDADAVKNMNNVVFWDIKTQFVLHRRHITSPLQSSAS
jgi:hypothetical protein